MNGPGGPGRPQRLDEGRSPIRPASVDIAAAILVFGGLFGLTQLVAGDFVITGRLPARDPILGVAAILYAASIGLGLLIRTGRAWFPALNLAGLFAIVYLAALGHAVPLLLGLVHAAAAVLLFRSRRWFSEMAAARRPVSEATGPSRGPVRQTGAGSSGRRSSRRPSGRR